MFFYLRENARNYRSPLHRGRFQKTYKIHILTKQPDILEEMDYKSYVPIDQLIMFLLKIDSFSSIVPLS